MWDIHIHIQCPSKFSEILSDELGETELIIEGVVSQALLELFDTVLVDGVTIYLSSSEWKEGEAPRS